MPFAVVQGNPLTVVPKDLYIPPDALEIFLDESFEGPLDLLLYLIKRQNLDILDIPVADITLQYMEYIGLMKDMRWELAAEYLLMAAMLAEIKSRMLLPRPKSDDDEEDGDPRAELVRRLQEYERFKKAAEDIDYLPRVNRDVHVAEVKGPDLKVVRNPPEVDLKDVLAAFKDIMQRATLYEHHQIAMEPLSVRERMSLVLGMLNAETFTDFGELFTIEEGKGGVVVSLLAILELIKQSMIEIVQTELYGPIHVKALVAITNEEEN
ncbi:MAG: ScpA family protein [Woeseiaceae bacterium]